MHVQYVVVDGDRFEGYVDPAGGELLPYACVPEADGLYLSVAAASILAKTHRDAHVVREMHPRFPLYGWDRNKGYGTPDHLRALAERGPCDEHRRSFAPIKHMR
jgi:ribonuclease HII